MSLQTTENTHALSYESYQLQLSSFIRDNADVNTAVFSQTATGHTTDLRYTVKEIPVSEGIHLTFIDTLCRKPLSIQSVVEAQDSIDISFTFSGSVRCNIAGNRHDIGTFDRLSSLTHYKGGLVINLSVPENQPLTMIKLRFTRKSFDEYCKYAGCILPKDMLYKIDYTENNAEQCSCFLPQEIYATAAQMISQLNNPASYYMQELCVDFTKMMVEHLYRGFSRIHPKQFVSYRDIDRVREAYDILSHNIVEPPKLIELAHTVGLNDYKLKTGFRQAYGMSVHETLNELRLEKAVHLLKEQDLSMTECAMSAGYGKSSDFSTAFKRKFGVTPYRIKKMKNFDLLKVKAPSKQ